MEDKRKARVVRFDRCSNATCNFPSSGWGHVKVTEDFVQLERGNATAISYTWGAFNRQRRVIGHWDDESEATMELGEEWNMSEF